MRTISLCLWTHFMIALAVTLNAQTNWEWQNPRPQGNDLTDIEVVNSQVAYAVGECGAIVKTTDGGITWQLLHLPRPITPQSVQFIDPQHGWIAGSTSDSVFLLATNNGGSTWTIEVGAQGARISYFHLNAFTAWLAVDSLLMRTTDGGTSWQHVSSTVVFTQLHFLDANNGWGIGARFFFRTTNGGVTWVSTSVFGTGFYELQRCGFVDETVGWASAWLYSYPDVVSGHVAKTTDGGSTWQEQLTVGGTFLYYYFTDLDPVTRDSCWATASDGSVFRTTNGGANWANTDGPTYLTQIAWLDNASVLGAGSCGSLFISTDSGLNWTHTSSGYTMRDASDMMVLDSARVYAIGGRTLLKTADAGIHWSSSTISQRQDFVGARSVWFTDSLKGWVGAEYGGGWGGLYRTTDGGGTWSTQIDSTHRVFAIRFASGTQGWFAEANRVHYTSDGGESWSLRSTSPSTEIISIFFTSPSEGWCGGYIGLWRSTDGGTTWNEVRPAGLSIYAVSIFFLDPQTGWVLTNGGHGADVYRTTDGGMTWGSCMLGPYPFLANFEFVDREHGWVVGPDYSQIILSTTDGGASWNQEESPTPNSLRRIRFGANRLGWLLADGGLILRTTNPVTGVEEEGYANPLPQHIELAQNYPNPFNPSTTIRFELPRQTGFTVSIFNVLGQKVRTYHDVHASAGVHEVVWDGKDDNGKWVASGVFVYRVEAVGLARSRSMILLK